MVVPFKLTAEFAENAEFLLFKLTAEFAENAEFYF